MNERTQTLNQLGIKFGTDKNSGYHDYLNFYEKFFTEFRNQSVKLLEIGVCKGTSLSVWEAYFPNGHIVGADIDRSSARFARSRVTIEIMDQSNIEDLVKVGVKHGPFDIVIEDGSHMWEHQITTLKTLFPFVRNGGLFIIEDLHTNFGDMTADYRGVARLSCVEYLKKLVDLRVADVQINIDEEEDAFLRTYGRLMRTITFYRRACLIEKASPLDHAAGDEPYVAIDQDPSAVGVVIVAHIGHEGDKASRSNWVQSGNYVGGIQAYAIWPAFGVTCDIWYRGRLASGEWTDWASQGRPVGTCGQMQDLTGFSVRIGDGAAAMFDLELIGKFAGLDDLVRARDGEPCVSPSGRGSLFGMQVVLRTKAAAALPGFE